MKSLCRMSSTWKIIYNWLSVGLCQRKGLGVAELLGVANDLYVISDMDSIIPL